MLDSNSFSTDAFSTDAFDIEVVLGDVSFDEASFDTEAFSTDAFFFDPAAELQPPILLSATVPVTGDQIILVFDKAVTFGAGGNTGVAGASYLSGDTTDTLIYTLDETVLAGQTVTVTYIQPGNGIEAADDQVDVASFIDQAVTNNSTLTAPTLLNAYIPSSGAALHLIFDQSVIIGAGGDTGMVMTSNIGGAITASYTSGAGSTEMIWIPAQTIQKGALITLAYSNPGNGIEANNDNVDLPDFSFLVVNNGSREGAVSYRDTKFVTKDWASLNRTVNGNKPYFYDQYRFSGRTFRTRDVPGIPPDD